MLGGEPGVGKSTVAAAVADRLAGAGFVVVRGWCSAAGMSPNWPWRRALGKVAPGLPFDLASAGPYDRAVLFAAVVDALEGLAAPLLIMLEDVHWADPASLALLRTVVDAAPGLPVALLATARDEATDASTALAELPTGVRRVPVAPLDPAAATALATRIIGPEHAAEVAARTGGNPFFITEVARLVAAHGPDALVVVPRGVREVLERRLARLSQPCHELLSAASVVAATATATVAGTAAAGRDPIDERLVAAVAGIDADEVRERLDEAVRSGLVEPDPAGGARLRFAHALVREVLAGGLAAGARARLHRRVAEAVPDDAAERLAYHWSRASGADAPARAAEWSLRAGDAALAGLGFDQAVAHLRRALDGPGVDRVATLIRLGRAQRLAGDHAGARESFLAAIELAGRVDDAAGHRVDRGADIAAAALGLGGGVIGFEVPIADGGHVAALRRALDALPDADGADRAAVLGRLSLALTGLAGPGERRRLAEQAVVMAEQAGDAEVTAGVLAAYCDAVAGPEYVDQRLASAERMLAAATDRVSAMLARRLRLVARLECGDFAEADREIDAYRRAAEAVAIPLYQWLPELWRGARALLDGDPGQALRHATAAEATGRRADSTNAALLGLTLRMHAHLTAGTAEEIAGEVNAMLATVADLPLPVTYRAAPALVLLAAGDPEPARVALRTYRATTAADITADAEWLEGHWALADIAVRLGDEAAAARLLDELRPYERLWAVDGIGAAVLGTVGEQVGRLAGLLGRRREAAERLATALADYERAGAPLLAARVRAAAGLPAPADAERVVGELIRDGRFWRLAWRGRASTVPDSKGVRDLAVLLARPGRPVPATELAGAVPGGGLGEVLDATARAAYRRRLAELDAAIDGTDPAHAERARTEREAIAAELAAAVGLHGPRMAGDPAEKARKAVTMRIRAAVRTIDAVDPALARHLRNAVKTGRVCAYEPDIDVVWRT